MYLNAITINGNRLNIVLRFDVCFVLWQCRDLMTEIKVYTWQLYHSVSFSMSLIGRLAQRGALIDSGRHDTPNFVVINCVKNVKSFLSHVDPSGGTDLRFCSHQPDQLMLCDHRYGASISRGVPVNTTQLSLVPVYTAWWQRHMGVNNLPKVVTWRRSGGRKLNLRPWIQRPNHWLPSHPIVVNWKPEKLAL